MPKQCETDEILYLLGIFNIDLLQIKPDVTA